MGCDYIAPYDPYSEERNMTLKLATDAWRYIGHGKPPIEAIQSAMMELVLVLEDKNKRKATSK
jgi:hypothetical protein